MKKGDRVVFIGDVKNLIHGPKGGVIDREGVVLKDDVGGIIWVLWLPCKAVRGGLFSTGHHSCEDLMVIGDSLYT